MSIQAPEKRRGGRRLRYGVKTQTLHVSFPPALLDRIKVEKGIRQMREPHEEWSAARVIVTELARVFSVDLTGSES